MTHHGYIPAEQNPLRRVLSLFLPTLTLVIVLGYLMTHMVRGDDLIGRFTLGLLWSAAVVAVIVVTGRRAAAVTRNKAHIHGYFESLSIAASVPMLAAAFVILLSQARVLPLIPIPAP